MAFPPSPSFSLFAPLSFIPHFCGNCDYSCQGDGWHLCPRNKQSQWHMRCSSARTNVKCCLQERRNQWREEWIGEMAGGVEPWAGVTNTAVGSCSVAVVGELSFWPYHAAHRQSTTNVYQFCLHKLHPTLPFDAQGPVIVATVIWGWAGKEKVAGLRSPWNLLLNGGGSDLFPTCCMWWPSSSFGHTCWVLAT